MIENSKNKMVKSSRNKGDLSQRDAYIIDKSNKGFTPTEILTMLKRDGFVPVARSRIYQILERKH